MPVQWSAAYQDLSELVAIALFCSLLGVVHAKLSTSDETFSLERVQDRLRDAETLIRVLDMDADMKDSESVNFFEGFIESAFELRYRKEWSKCS